MISGYQEQIFYHYILGNSLFLNITKPEFFVNPVIREVFEVAKEHTLKYKDAPSKEQLIQLLQIKGLGEKFTNDMISGIYNSKLLLNEFDSEWLQKNVGPWIQVRTLDATIRKAIAFMKTTAVTAENAHEVVEKIRHMISSETSIDFSFNMGKDFFDPASHLQTRLARTSSGYDYIDICTKGGYWKGSLMVLFGMPKSGKSMWLCNMAAKSVLEGYNTAYITLELQEELVNMRIGANMLNIPLDDYEKFTLDQPLLKQKLNAIKQKSFPRELGQLHIKEFPSSTASANDMGAYLRKTQEILGYKFDNIFIDYINIMKNWRNPNSENTYLKIKQISEDIRAMGQENNWSIISVSQTNRCISPDSIVEIKDYGKIEIKNIKEGDFILGDTGYVKVKKIYHNKNTKTYKIKTKSKKEIICSKNHIFPINDHLLQLYDIKVGDKLFIKTDNLKEIEIIEDEIISIEEHGIIDTIDITICSKNRLFFANNILTHNSGWEANDLSITSIAESAGLLHTVDILFGIITNAEMKARGEYFLKCLANRVAGYENTRKRFLIDWKFARIEEDRNAPIQDMEFFINSVAAGHKYPRGQKPTNVYMDTIVNQGTLIADKKIVTNDLNSDEINITGANLF